MFNRNFRVAAVFILLLPLVVLTSSCALLDRDRNDLPFDLALEATCSNSTADQWTLLGLKDETVASILVHPENPQVIFAGTGFDFSAGRQGKIFRTTDCGANWELMYEGGSFIHGLLLHPDDPYTLYGWRQNPTGGLLRSTDGGDSWQLHSEGIVSNSQGMAISEVLIHPETPELMYASTTGAGSGRLYKSAEGGQQWTDITDNHDHLSSGATAMLLHPDQPELLLHSGNITGIISRSEDGGDTWEDVFLARGLVTDFEVNPQDLDQIVAASSGEGVLVSEDRGKSWRIETVLDSDLNIRDVSFIDGSLFVVIEGGVVRTNDFETYTEMNEGIELGYTEEGFTLTLPRTIVSDKNTNNLYLGYRYISENRIEGGFGGIFVRKVE